MTTTSEIKFKTDTNNARFISLRNTLKPPIPLVWSRINQGMWKGTLSFTVWQTYSNYSVINRRRRSLAEFSGTCLCILNQQFRKKKKKDAERWRMTYSFIWGVPRYLSSSFSAEGSLLSMTCMRGYFSSVMCFWNRELTTCTFVKTLYMLISFFVLTICDAQKRKI